MPSWHRLLKFYLMEDEELFFLHMQIVADGLVMQGARSSATVVLTWLFQNILISVTEGLR